MSDYIQATLLVQLHDSRVLNYLDKLTPAQKFKIFLDSIRYDYTELFRYMWNDQVDYDRDTVLINLVFYGKKDYAKAVIENTELSKKVVTTLTALSEGLPAPYLIEYLNAYPDYFFEASKIPDVWADIPLSADTVEVLFAKYVNRATDTGNEFESNDRKKLRYLGDLVSKTYLQVAVSKLEDTFASIINDSEDFSQEEKEEIIENIYYETASAYFNDETVEYLMEAESSSSSSSSSDEEDGIVRNEAAPSTSDDDACE